MSLKYLDTIVIAVGLKFKILLKLDPERKFINCTS